MSLSLTSDILKVYSYNDTFIETGTFTGGGISIALDCGFKKVISIEIDPRYYYAVNDRYLGNDIVEIYLGDSIYWLPYILERTSKPCTIFLDSHLASGSSLGTVEVPLLKELEAIRNHSIKNHTLLIDDVRGFGYDPSIDPNLSKEWLQVTKEKVIEKIFEINPNYKITYHNTTNGLNDLMVAEA